MKKCKTKECVINYPKKIIKSREYTMKCSLERHIKRYVSRETSLEMIKIHRKVVVYCPIIEAEAKAEQGTKLS